MDSYLIQMQNGFTGEAIELKEVEACFFEDDEGKFINTSGGFISVTEAFGIDLIPNLLTYHESMGHIPCYLGDELSNGDVELLDGTKLKNNGDFKFISTRDGTKWGMVFGIDLDTKECELLGYCQCNGVPLKAYK